MLYSLSVTALVVFGLLVAGVLGLSFFLARKAKSAHGYFAAHGQIPWFINGVAFAGDYLSAASFLGICGMIAFYGYDGFLYSIGFLAGWIVALFLIAEPIKRLGKYTFADALDSQFNSRSIKLAAAISTLIVSLFYLIPQMVGAGTLIKPLLGLPIYAGVIGVGAVVILIVLTAGMVSTTWVQFVKGSLLVLFCTALTIAILARGLTTNPDSDPNFHRPRTTDALDEDFLTKNNLTLLPSTGPWKRTPYVRLQNNATGAVAIWRKQFITGWSLQILSAPPATECQYLSLKKDGALIVNGLPQMRGAETNDFFPVGNVDRLGPDAYGNPVTQTGPLTPTGYLRALLRSRITTWQQEKDITDADGSKVTIFYPVNKEGSSVLVPGNSPLFASLANHNLTDRLNFISLMLALFCGTAALPHILIRYYTVKDQASARKSTVVGITAIGLFYVLTLFLGLGAMTSGMLDPTDSNMAAPLLAKSFGPLAFAIICAIAFTTVLGTVSGLIMAAAGTVAHDILDNFFKLGLDDTAKVRVGKVASVVVGIIAIILGILFQKMNVSFLVGWAFNVAASANLPALIMLLFWKRTTSKGIAASILVGLISSLAWILLSADAFSKIYNLPASRALVPFNQPAIVTLPLAFVTLIVVSLLTQNSRQQKPAAVA